MNSIDGPFFKSSTLTYRTKNSSGNDPGLFLFVYCLGAQGILHGRLGLWAGQLVRVEGRPRSGVLDAGAVREDHFLGLALEDAGMGRDGAGEPDVAADDRVPADGDAPEDGGVGVHRHAVFQDGVAGNLARHALRVVGEVPRTQCNPLIQGHMRADDGRLSDDDAGAVVDGEVVADDRTGMDVDAGGGMGILREHAGDDRDAQQMQFMGRTVVDHRRHGRIAEDDLLEAAHGRVVVGDGFHVGFQQFPDPGDLVHEGGGRDGIRHGLQLGMEAPGGIADLPVAVLGENDVLELRHHHLEVADGLVEGKGHGLFGRVVLRVKKDGGQVPFARVGEKGDDRLAGIFRFPRQGQGRGEGRSGADAHEETQFSGQFPPGLHGRLVGHGDDLIDDRRIIRVRLETGTDALDLVGSGDAGRQEGG